ncbi:MAG TPA: hypothetical protein VD902_18515, partial [Symbiobacteriaceae bacterium]|nr:hypothetical protein [Symbiobacteriaceae bacterium]
NLGPLDHLDSFLRDTETCGMGETPAHVLLTRFALTGTDLQAADRPAARELLRRVAADHRLFLKPRCVAMDALATMIFEEAGLSVDTLLSATDETALTLAGARAPDLVDRLRNRPWSVDIRKDDGGAGRQVGVSRLYLFDFQVDGRPLREAVPEAEAVYQSLALLLGEYRVTLA